jgi:hypothetical protein
MIGEGETAQVLRNAFTGRFDEGLAEGPVPIEKLCPGSFSGAGSEGMAPLVRKCGARNSHEIGQRPALFDVDPDGTARDSNSDAAAGVADVELHGCAMTIVIKEGLSVGASRETQRLRLAGHHWRQQDAQASMGGREAPAVCLEPESGRASTFRVAEEAAEIRPVTGTGRTEPKDEFVRARSCFRFRRECGKQARVQRLRCEALDGPGPRKFRRGPSQSPDEGVDAHVAI